MLDDDNISIILDYFDNMKIFKYTNKNQAFLFKSCYLLPLQHF